MIPVLLAGVALYGMGKRVDVYGALTHGAEEGLTVLLKVLPALVGLLTAVAMFRASGALEWLTGLCAPALEFLGIPPETTPLMLVPPSSCAEIRLQHSGAAVGGGELTVHQIPHLFHCPQGQQGSPPVPGGPGDRSAPSGRPGRAAVGRST